MSDEASDLQAQITALAQRVSALEAERAPNQAAAVAGLRSRRTATVAHFP